MSPTLQNTQAFGFVELALEIATLDLIVMKLCLTSAIWANVKATTSMIIVVQVLEV